jgi:predicted phage-related endonuclease
VSTELTVFTSHEEWLEARGSRIGGSDASAVVGMNPYKTNVDLWMEKTGLIVPEDISAAAYGQREKKSPTPYQKALERIACRLMGEWKPLPKLSKLTK